MIEEQDTPLNGPLHFNALVRPHRSLSKRGFLIVMGILVAINFGAGAAFIALGAWPVFFYCGLDLALVWWAFRANYRAAAAHETVQVSDDLLLLRRVDQYGRVRAIRLQPYWLRVDMEEEPDGATHLYLRSHGKSYEVARELSPKERMSFAYALRLALIEMKSKPLA
ncbi:MAG: DUF2244 domain-containing protein [Parvibaculum sp.]|nr:DUF2244 domain-containing protein [Parvibaculum sp.]